VQGEKTEDAQHGEDRELSLLPKIDFGRRRKNRQLPTQTLLQLLQNEAPRLWELAQVVGKWVWIQFDSGHSTGRHWPDDIFGNAAS
jgi:hypothetical protein